MERDLTVCCWSGSRFFQRMYPFLLSAFRVIPMLHLKRFLPYAKK